MKEWERKQKRIDPEFDINQALTDYFTGSYD